MERLYGIDAACRAGGSDAACVATIGFFDGVHVGHRRLLDELKAWARERGARSAVVTFSRHPQAVLGDHPPTPVVSLEHRLLLLEREGIDATLVLEFDDELRHWTPEEFTEKVFHDALGANALLMGFDSAYGFGRQGTFEYIHARSEDLGLDVRQCVAQLIGQERVSSTAVREAIRGWNLPRLETLLGRPFTLLGRVIEGDGRGRGIGFPTANLDLGDAAVPALGVYLADVRRLGAQPCDEPRGSDPFLPAVMNIGRRPTFTSETQAPSGEAFDARRDTVEVHVLDLEDDLYGEFLEVKILAKQRDEKKFGGVEELVAQIQDDVEARRVYRG